MDAVRTPACTVAPRALARIEHSEALLGAIRRRVDALNLSHEMLDHLTGLASGYCSKLLSNPPIKRLGNLSLFLVLEAIGLDIVLVENPEQLERLKNRDIPRRRPVMLARPRTLVFTRDFLRRNGTKGARARNHNLTPLQRSMLAKRAARARWARYRASAVAASQPAPASP